MPRSLLSFLNYWIYFLTGSSFRRSPGFFPRPIKTPVSRKKFQFRRISLLKENFYWHVFLDIQQILFTTTAFSFFFSLVSFVIFFSFLATCAFFCFFLNKKYSDTHLAMRAGLWSKCFHLVNFWKHTTFLTLAISLSLFFGRVTKEGMICVTRISSSSKIFKTCIKILWTCSKIPSLVDIHVDWLNWFHILILVGGQSWFFCHHL